MKPLLLGAVCLLSLVASAYDYGQDFDPNDRSSWPVITIILDDVGNQYLNGRRAAALPGPVALAVLPHTPFGPALAELAYEQGKEILLHQPLQAAANNELLGTGAIDLEDDAQSLARTLADNLAAVPHVSGVNNHMGSLLTRHPGHMRWLMQALQLHGELFFVDSFTSKQSVALIEARAAGLPAIRRHVFLDNDASEENIRKEFKRLKHLAKKQGYAVAIGHPYPETLTVLEQELAKLAQDGYRLISVQSMIEHQLGSTVSTRPTAPEPSLLVR